LRGIIKPLAAFVFLGGGMMAAAHYATHSAIFAVRRVEVRGGERTPASEFESLLQSEAAGRNIFLLPLEELRLRVEEHPWVRRALLYRVLPDGLRLVVEEPLPTAVAAWPDDSGREQLVWLDELGLVIEPVSAQEMAQGLMAPLLVGFGGSGEREAHTAAGTAALHAIRRENKDFLQRIAVLDVSNSLRFEMRLRDYESPLYLDPSGAARNLGRFLDLEAALRRRHPAPLYVDLRWENQIVVMPQDGMQP
jgi:cell division septal protein FtsQ